MLCYIILKPHISDERVFVTEVADGTNSHLYMLAAAGGGGYDSDPDDADDEYHKKNEPANDWKKRKFAADRRMIH